MTCVQSPKSQPSMERPLPIGKRDSQAGFTLMELVIVLFIVALLAALVVPNVAGSMRRAQETALAQNLSVMRQAIDDYRADRAEWPADLADLVEARYIRFVPEDTVADDDAGWAVVEAEEESGIMDVRSTSSEVGSNGVPYSEW